MPALFLAGAGTAEIINLPAQARDNGFSRKGGT
jgi:hypothetical protein